MKEKIKALFEKVKELFSRFINGVKAKQKKHIALLVSLSLVLVCAVGAVIAVALPEKEVDPPKTESEEVQESDSEGESESESESESVSESESESETETETETEETTEETTAETTAAPDTTVADTTQGSSSSSVDIDLGWGDVSGSGGSSSSSGSSGSSGSSNELGSDETGGRIHTYINAPINEYEDTSNTLEFEPLRQEGATEKYGSYNVPKIKLEHIKPGVFLKGDADYSSTLIGYDGFLFCQDSFQDYDGTSLFNQNRLDVLIDNMVTRNAWVESLTSTKSVDGKKHMYVVIIPNKNSVYYDYMPESYTMGSYRRIDQIINALRDVGITVIDGRESLLAAKAANPQRSLYYKTDTHWNNHGGFFVYQQMMNEIKKDFPDVVIHNRSDYQINYCETFMKDQAYYLGYYDATSELGAVYTLKNGKTAYFVNSQRKDRWGQFAFSYQWSNGYSDHLYWYQWRNDGNKNAPNMYMLRDSYSIALNGFLKDSFYKSTYNWTYNFRKKDITSSGADVVIVEVVEKYITKFANQMPFSN